MSVHGEYARTLEILIDTVRQTDETFRETALQGLLEARIGANPDLTTAAKRGLTAAAGLREIESKSTRTAEVRAHFEGHCRAIIGLPTPEAASGSE